MFRVDCPCGNQLSVTAAHAGSDLNCDCGQAVTVPRLSQLRQSAGLDAFESSIVDTIRRLIREGDLPVGEACQRCGAASYRVEKCTVDLEQPWVQHSGRMDWRWVLLFISWPVWLLSYVVMPAGKSDPEVRIRGRELSLDVPLHLCRLCGDTMQRGGFSDQTISELLAVHPATEQLLREYPDAKFFPAGR